MQSPFGCTWSEEIAHRCTARYLAPLVTDVAAALGAAMDAGVITLDQALDPVRSCSDAGQLGDAMAMVAATVPAEPDEFDCYLLGLTAELVVLGGGA